MKIQCIRCKRVINLKSSFEGRRVRCPNCKQVLQVGSSASREPDRVHDESESPARRQPEIVPNPMTRIDSRFNLIRIELQNPVRDGCLFGIGWMMAPVVVGLFVFGLLILLSILGVAVSIPLGGTPDVTPETISERTVDNDS